MDEATVLAEVMTEVAIAELPAEDQPQAIVDGLHERGYSVQEIYPQRWVTGMPNG